MSPLPDNRPRDIHGTGGGPATPILSVGDRARHRVFDQFEGVIESVSDSSDPIYVLRLDDDVPHFRRTILVSHKEIIEPWRADLYDVEDRLERARYDVKLARDKVRLAQRTVTHYEDHRDDVLAEARKVRRQMPRGMSIREALREAS